jgi:trehalose 6-phosphate phosphatase
VPARLPGFLARLARRHGSALALVSGRKIAELDALFRPWQGAAAGLHGGERRRADGSRVDAGDAAAAAALARLRPEILDWARHRAGVRVEDKGATIALHYRARPAAAGELGAVARRLCAEADGALRLIAGKMVFELQPARRNKGAAVAAFLAEPPFRGRPAVFIGDDVTDEDGFAEVNRRGGLSIRVGSPQATAARHRLPSVAAALAWLGCR